MSFHREKYVTKGGPDGGNGGNGGNLILRATSNRNTLHHFRGVKLFKAENGKYGESCNRSGKAGEDLILEVPTGTLVLDASDSSESKGELLADLTADGESFLVTRGGLGGKGNANFTSSTRQMPRFAELGEPGEERELKLELKLIADVGIIGLPSVGKSTLISVISSAKPKIADYHFTTLAPNLGVVEYRGESFVVSDLPGLIRGASRGKGLGIQFLKHAERVRFFFHLVDGNSKTPLTDYKTIREELRKYNPQLVEKPEILILSKADVCEASSLEKLAEKFKKKLGKNILLLASPTHRGVEDLLNSTIQKLQEIKKAEADLPDLESPLPIYKPHLEARSKAFAVKRQNKKLFLVDGPRINQIAIMSDLSNADALARMQDVLDKFGVNRELRRFGAEEGVQVEIVGKRFEWWG